MASTPTSSSASRRSPPPKVGDKIEITQGSNRGIVGIVRFFGDVKFAGGRWLGVELAFEGGKNDGMVQGERYFDCPAKKGLFVKPPVVKVVPPETPLTSAEAAVKILVDNEDARSTTSASTSDAPDERPPLVNSFPSVEKTAPVLPPPIARQSSKAEPPASPRPKAGAAARTPVAASSAKSPPTKKPVESKTAATKKPPSAATTPKAAPPLGRTPSKPSKPVSITSPRAARPTGNNHVAEDEDADNSPAIDKPLPTIEAKRTKLEDVQSRRIEAMSSKDDQTLLEAAQDASAATKRAESRQADRIAKANARQAEAAQKDLEDARAENADLKAKLKTVQATVLELKKSELKATSSNAKLEEKIAELHDLIESLTLDKELAEETSEEAKGEADSLRQQLKNLQLELDMAKQNAVNSHEQLLKSLPNDQAETARIVQQNKALADACRQLRDKSLAETERFEASYEQAKRTISKLQEECAALKDTKSELAKAKAEILELKEEVDASSGAQDTIQDLTDKNEHLEEQLDELKSKIKDMQQLIDTAEEIEENQKELEQQLQNDLANREAELALLDKKHKVAQVKIDDLQQTINQFRAKTSALQAELALVNAKLASNQSDNKDEVDRSRDTLERMYKLQQQMADVRTQAAAHGMATITAEQAQQQLTFIKAYVPDNMAIDENALTLLTLIGRLNGKAQLVAKLLEDFYSPEVVLLAGGSGSDGGLKLATAACKACELMSELCSALSTLRRALCASDPDNYSSATARSKNLGAAEAILDEFLGLIAKDRLTDQTPLSPLTTALETVRKFTTTFFAPSFDSKMVDVDLSVTNDALPRTDSAEGLVFSALRIKYRQAQVRANLRVLNDAVASSTAEASVLADGKAINPTVATDEKEAQRLLAILDEAQIRLSVLVNNVVDKAQTLRKPGNAELYLSTEALLAAWRNVDAHSLAATTRISEVGLNAKSIILRSSPGAALAPVVRVLQIETEDKPETSLSLFNRLQESLTVLSGLLDERINQVNAKAQSAGSGSAIAVAGRTGLLTPWEKHAKSVRQELFEAASVRQRLEDSNTLIAAKNQDLLTEQKRAREYLQKINLLESRLKIVEVKAGDTAGIAAELARAKKESDDLQALLDTAQREIDKMGRENGVLRAKTQQLEKQVAPKAAAKPEDDVIGAVAAGEVDMLRKTVRILRRQLAAVRASAFVTKIAMTLPPLPLISTKVHSATHHSAPENLAREVQRDRPLEDLMIAHQRKVDSLSKGIRDTSKRLRELRSSPVLVDLSTGSAASSRQFLRQQAEKQKLETDCSQLKSKLFSFLATPSLTTPLSLGGVSVGSVHNGQIASSAGSGTLIGRVTVASAHASTQKLSVGRGDLLKIQSFFV